MSLVEKSRPESRNNHSEKKENENRFSFGYYAPRTCLENDELEIYNRTGRSRFSAEKILDITGVERRHFPEPDETVSYMAYEASQQALGGQVPDAVFFTTSHPDGENFAQRLIDEFDFPSYVEPLDFFAACSGYARTKQHLFENKDHYEGMKILTVSSEDYSPYTKNLDRAIFDAGAVAEFSEFGVDYDILAAEGMRFAEHLSSRIKMEIDPSLMKEPFITEYVPRSDDGFFFQDGPGVLEAVSDGVPYLVRAVVSASRYFSLTEHGILIAHQGSRNVVRDSVASNLPEFNVVEDFVDGNLSSGSIPRAKMREMQEGRIQAGDVIVGAGFGAGLFASVYVERLK